MSRPDPDRLRQPEVLPPAVIVSDSCELNESGDTLTICNIGERTRQQDLALRVDGRRLAAIDGMGGMGTADDGGTCAAIVARNFGVVERGGEQVLLPPDEAARAAQTEMLATFPGAEADKEPGAAVAVATIDGDTLDLRATSDSRGYVIRSGALIAITGDNRQKRKHGETMEVFERRMDGTRRAKQLIRVPGATRSTYSVNGGINAIRQNMDIESNGISVQLKKGDLIVLSTDGVNEAVDSQALQMILMQEINRVGDATPWLERVQARLEAMRKVGSPIVVTDNFTLQVYCHGMSIEEYFRQRRQEIARGEPGVMDHLRSIGRDIKGAFSRPAPSRRTRSTEPPEDGSRLLGSLPSAPRGVSRNTYRNAILGCGVLAAVPCVVGSCGGLALGGAVLVKEGYDAVVEALSPKVSAAELYAPVCDDAISGKWTVGGKPMDMAPYAKHLVDLDVTTPKGPVRVHMEDVPGACLNGRKGGMAPRAIAAEGSKKAVPVTLTDGSVAVQFEFTPNPGKKLNAVKGPDETQKTDLDVQFDGSPWMHCEAPISLGCTHDSKDMAEAYAAFKAAQATK